MDSLPPEPDDSEFVEVDPTGRYGRYNEILGKGASKIVYRAFDEYEGIEVAWNQVKLHDFLKSPEELERLYCEIHLLKTLKHKSIMKFYTSWVDTSKRNINFVTEMFTSGTLRQYRLKHRRVNIRAVKRWCMQILRGLLYLHSHDPPVIHRDLKCDNIFINGNQGEVKIGDLGLAAILHKSHAAHIVGTPEFMAPEVYEEEYNELVDIYSFGMCILEMVTFEYPYSECTHPAQIYKKVVSGTKPQALNKVKDPEVRQFVEKCLATASRRLPARELLKDPFLQIDDFLSGSGEGEASDMGPPLRQPYLIPHHSNGSLITNDFLNDSSHHATDWGWDYSAIDMEPHGIELFNCQEDEFLPHVDITIKGRSREDGGIFLRLRITDEEGQIRNIYFPFDIEADTALSVATEMVAELDIIDHDVTRIAEMIDGEIYSLIPEWTPGPGVEETPGSPASGTYHNCMSNGSSGGSLIDFLSLNNPSCSNMQGLHCSPFCAAMHGRFEEITYQVNGSEQCITEGAPVLSSLSNDLDLRSLISGDNHSDEEKEQLDRSAKDESVMHMSSHVPSTTRKSVSLMSCDFTCQQGLESSEVDHRQPLPNVSGDYENEIRQELRWLKSKYQMELEEYSGKQLGRSMRSLNPSPAVNGRDKRLENGVSDPESHWGQVCEVNPESSVKSFYNRVLLRNSLRRTRSLPIDAVGI